eukprot:554111-Karenia_brevis.AAC.1
MGTNDASQSDFQIALLTNTFCEDIKYIEHGPEPRCGPWNGVRKVGSGAPVVRVGRARLARRPGGGPSTPRASIIMPRAALLLADLVLLLQLGTSAASAV